ncbi:hypothetical protein GDO81_013764 [Engystomops pustulosus]|uniref:PH domain-containing protein n=1 Tax=Engystomops pustulosus TaxID=76066 RepID=A0AAV7B5G2_ENGPU|nr:hypothetical protein GDO81_013764 [Engystomops pustulosus]
MNRSIVASPVAIKEGDLEKRSDSFLQLWKKRRCVLTADGLHLYTDSRKKGKVKILCFDSLAKLECVERKGERVYFTLVTMEGQEIDFRCRERSRWNAEITLALVFTFFLMINRSNGQFGLWLFVSEEVSQQETETTSDLMD